LRVPEAYSRAGGTECSAYEKRTGELDIVRQQTADTDTKSAKHLPPALRRPKREYFHEEGFFREFFFAL
jgi:hypothetical protein